MNGPCGGSSSGVCEINKTEFIFLAGERYRKFISPSMPNMKVPLKGLRIGEQLQTLKRLIQ